MATFQWKMSKGGKDGMADLDFHPATNAVLGLQGFFGLVIDDVWKVGWTQVCSCSVLPCQPASRLSCMTQQGSFLSFLCLVSLQLETPCRCRRHASCPVQTLVLQLRKC